MSADAAAKLPKFIIVSPRGVVKLHAETVQQRDLWVAKLNELAAAAK